MRSPLVQLLTARRFAPLFVTQFLGAFNDNLLKSALGILVTFRLAEQAGIERRDAGDARRARCSSRRSFSSPARRARWPIAFDKALIARWVKIAEIGIMALGAWGLWQGSVPVLLAALFCLGTHSTVFGPIKYALLPQHLRRERAGRRQRADRGGHVPRDSARHDPRRQHRALRQRRARSSACAASSRAIIGWLAAAADSARRRRRYGGEAPRVAPAARHDRRRQARHEPPAAAAADSRHVVVLAVRRSSSYRVCRCSPRTCSSPTSRW